MIMSASVLTSIWHLVKPIISFFPAWVWSVIASISGIFFGVSLSIKNLERRTRILAIVITLVVLLISSFSVHHLTETKKQKRFEERIKALQGTIEFQRELLKKQTILVETRVKVGGNPHFISGDFVDDRPLIEVLPHSRPTEITHSLIEDIEFTNIIKDISLTNTDEGITIHSKKFDCELSTARPKKNLSAGRYVTNLTVTPCILWRTESGEFEKIEGESQNYQTEFIVAEQFDIKDFSVWMKPTEERLPWGLPSLETTISYVFTESASSVEILVYDPTGKLVCNTGTSVHDLTTKKWIRPRSSPPTHAGYNEYPLSELEPLLFPRPFLLYNYVFKLRAEKDKKAISKTTLFLPTLEIYPKQKDS